MSGLFHKKTLRERELKDGKKPEEKARLITWLAQKKKDGQEDIIGRAIKPSFLLQISNSNRLKCAK